MELIWVKALAQGLQMLYGVKQAKPFLMSPLYSQLHINYLTLCVCVWGGLDSNPAKQVQVFKK